MTNTQHDYWKDAYDGAAEEGGLGTYGLAEASLGYFVYAGGFRGNDRIEKCFFQPQKYGDEAARAAARSKANAFAAANPDAKGVPEVRWCHALHLFRESCIRGDGTSVSEPTDRGEGWSSDQFDPVPLWTLRSESPSSSKVRLEAMNQFGIQPGVQFYGRFAKQNDPYKVHMGIQDDEDQSGNPRYKQFWNVAEIYESKEAMLAVVGAAGMSSVSVAGSYTLSQEALDAGWSMEEFKKMWPTIHERLNVPKPLAESTRAKVMKEYSLTEADVDLALSQYIPM